ncbi:hypothetical protein D3C87_1965370 [compost metagenome]
MKSLIAIAMIIFSTQATFARSLEYQGRPFAEGPSFVTLDSDMAFVEVSGDAAALIFNSMKVPSYFSQAPDATEKSELKDLGPLNCSKTGVKFRCSVAADLVAPQ